MALKWSSLFDPPGYFVGSLPLSLHALCVALCVGHQPDTRAGCCYASSLVELLPGSVCCSPSHLRQSAQAETTDVDFSQFWRLEVQDQGVIRFGFF